MDAKTRSAVAVSHTNVREFAEKSLRKSWSGKNRQGAKVGERFDPFERVGIYVPGGTAPLVSTAVMTCTLAAAAGVPEIVVTTPADKSGAVNPALLHALRVAGATEVYKVGGAQAVAALAYGTESVRARAEDFRAGQCLCGGGETAMLRAGGDRSAAGAERNPGDRGRDGERGMDRGGPAGAGGAWAWERGAVRDRFRGEAEGSGGGLRGAAWRSWRGRSICGRWRKRRRI